MRIFLATYNSCESETVLVNRFRYFESIACLSISSSKNSLNGDYAYYFFPFLGAFLRRVYGFRLLFGSGVYFFAIVFFVAFFGVPAHRPALRAARSTIAVPRGPTAAFAALFTTRPAAPATLLVVVFAGVFFVMMRLCIRRIAFFFAAMLHHSFRCWFFNIEG